jgi:hypothetical protein
VTRSCPLCGVGAIPSEVETRAWLEQRWRFKRSGLTQTALVADVNLAEYERVAREAGRWSGPWRLL